MLTRTLYLLIALCYFTAYAQKPDHWSKYSWLTGTWENADRNDSTNGVFSLLPELEGKVLVRHNHSELHGKQNAVPQIHDDLLVVYPGENSSDDKSIYFDNEGHVINYTVSTSDSAIVFLSDQNAHGMTFRLSYIRLQKDLINIRFEISREPGKFFTYLESKCARLNR